MATRQVFHATNVTITVAPPVHFVPTAAGVGVPAGGGAWNVITNSSGYAAGSAATFAVEARRGGVWVQEAGVGGYTLGSYTDSETGISTSINQFTIGPFPDGATSVRLRMDSIPAGTLAAITVNLV